MLQDTKSTALLLLRLVLALLIFIHGAARIAYGSVDDFGGFLSASGFPLGFYVAWAITLFEIVGSVLLAVGYYAWIIAAVFIVELAAGIVLIHYKEGWFVVGHGRNGVEYSILLIAAFLTIAAANFKRGK
jgi:putative oxidoreductase